MALRPRYTAVPAVPQTGVAEWQSQVLNALKENVELLTGTRGEPDLASAAINRALLSVSPPEAQEMTRVSAQGAGVNVSTGFTIENNTVEVTGVAAVPLQSDYNDLLTDVQLLANDVARLRATVAVLVAQLRG